VLESSIFIKAIILGIIEGLTEFIPVSSTAHLIISSYIIEFESVRNNVFEIAIQIGAILAICVVYRNKIIETIFKINQPKAQKFSLNLILAFIPSVILGVAFHEYIKSHFFTNFSIALALIFGGLIMIFVERIKHSNDVDNIDKINYRTSLIIGLCQCLAMIPGVSRSGATIIGAMCCGLDRKSATEFSFFLAIPTISSACIYDIYKNFSILSFNDFGLIAVGCIASFISAILVIKWFIKFVSKYSFIGFGFYRILLGFLILFFLN
jgi:undecaprenyl-diphosphatase